jgi:hypothetical protein
MNTFVWVEKLISLILRLRPQRLDQSSLTVADPWQSPWLGVGALVCLLSTWAAAAVLPYMIAEGTFGAPIVKTKEL